MWRKLSEIFMDLLEEVEPFLFVLICMIIAGVCIISFGLVPVIFILIIWWLDLFIRIKPAINRWMIDREIYRTKSSWEL